MTELDSSQTIAWKELIHRLNEFVAAWEEADSPPDLEGFIAQVKESEQRVWLVELIKVDLEYRWEGEHEGRFLEDYALRFPELCKDDKFPLDLIYEEYHIRRQLGEEIELEEFRIRFPEQAHELDSLFEFESPDASTSLHKNGIRARFEAGQTLDDFDLLMPLGEGAFAQVFLARQISMQRLVALKISEAKGEEHKTLAQLDHPHIVRVFSQTVLEDRAIRLLYMQYHPGGTLKDVVEAMRKLPEHERNGKSFLDQLNEFLAKRGAEASAESLTRRKLEQFDWQQVVCWIGARLAEALDYSHSKGVLHRDLKPANVLVHEDGSPKLADFNISFCKQIEGSNPVTYFGGSLAYMSPEQLEACDPTHDRRPEDLDPRSDVY
ncbi:MAG TPA: serine/threonine-protein kinase, partial [Planctomycetaceae bacterium]|nr:serine/threonine-protein kinase [Planctomycetaceae bacterium]